MARSPAHTYWSEDDGRDHVRISTQGKSWLGRYLANESKTPFTVDTLGSFDSLEAMWQYLASGSTHEAIRNTSGERALRCRDFYLQKQNPYFKSLVIQGLRAKIDQTPGLKEALRDNRLPLIQYRLLDNEPEYVSIGKNRKHDWFFKEIGLIVDQLRNER